MLLQEKKCEFFDWVYDDHVSECVACKSLIARVDEIEKAMGTLHDKFKRVKANNAELKATNDGL